MPKPVSLALTIRGCHIVSALKKLKFQLLCALIKKHICCNSGTGFSKLSWAVVKACMRASLGVQEHL
eukprot:scaffold139231_cov15-Tisochrysis_lutea.AAC.1